MTDLTLGINITYKEPDRDSFVHDVLDIDPDKVFESFFQDMTEINLVDEIISKIKSSLNHNWLVNLAAYALQRHMSRRIIGDSLTEALRDLKSKGAKDEKAGDLPDLGDVVDFLR